MGFPGDAASRAADADRSPAPGPGTSAPATRSTTSANTTQTELEIPSGRGNAPGRLLPRLTGLLESLIIRGVARRDRGDVIALHLRPEEAADGGLATISMPVDIPCPNCADTRRPSCFRCSGYGRVRQLFSAWLTVPRRVTDGAILAASVELPDALAVVRFRVLIDQPT